MNLNDSVVKPVRRENSNTTNTTHITGVTASTAVTHNTMGIKNNFYQTQYKTTTNGNVAAKGGFFPQTGNLVTANPANFVTDLNSTFDEISQKPGTRAGAGSLDKRGGQQMIPPGTAGSVAESI